MDMDDAAGDLPGAQLAKSVVDRFNRLVADGNRLDLAAAHQRGELPQLVGRTHIGTAQHKLALNEYGERHLPARRRRARH